MTDRPATPAPAGPAPRFPNPGPGGPTWEQLFPVLPPDVQHDLLRRALDRGGLTTVDVPTPLPVAATASPTDRLLAADLDRLPAYDPAPLADADHPPAEAHALSAALGCPDLFLVDADPGPDQHRFAAALAAETARAGGRVLVVTPSPADADAVLAQLAEDAELLVGRALDRHEHPDRLPPASASRTARAHGDAVLADARTRTADTIRQREARLAALRSAGQLAELRKLDDGHAATLARFDAEAGRLAAELDAKRKELTELRDRLHEHGEKSGGVLGRLVGLFSRHAVAVSPAELEAQARAAEEAVAGLEAEVVRLTAERDQVEANYRTARELLPRDEAGRRVEWPRLVAAFEAAGLEPPDADLGRAVAAARARAERVEAELASARLWAADLDARGPELVRRFLDQVQVVVATFDAVGVDPLTLPPDSGEPAFTRLVLTDADRLDEAGFVHAARFANRWVLVGSAAGPAPRGRQRGNGRPFRPSPFRRLWGRLHREPWAHEAGRLVARLADADPDGLHREPLADRPEVELRFARDAAGSPVLAEVAFPPATPAAAAKEFLARELGEVRLSPCGPVHWHESADRVTACWPAADGPAADWAEIGPGVREKVVGTGPDCRTAAVDFDRSAGWDREAAGRWLADRTGPGPRTAVLPRPTVVATAPTRLAAGVTG
jgi:hypothetical protein